MPKKKVEWKSDPALETVNGFETWTHTAPHSINDDEIDGDVDLSDIIDDE